MDLYDDIKRKYGPTIPDAQEFLNQALERYRLLADLEQNDQDLKKELDTLEKELRRIANKITQARQKTSLSLQKTIEKELHELGIAQVQFESRVVKGDLNRYGQDKVTFYIIF